MKVKFPQTWTYESAEVYRAFLVDPATGACPADTQPVYRLYNNRPDANHRYTSQLGVFVFMKGKGYIPEGDGSPATPVAFCAPAGGDVVPMPTNGAPVCNVGASTTSPAPGSSLTLNANCANDPTAFLWTGCASTQSTCTTTRATAGTATYTLYTANATGPGAPPAEDLPDDAGGAQEGGPGGDDGRVVRRDRLGRAGLRAGLNLAQRWESSGDRYDGRAL